MQKDAETAIMFGVDTAQHIQNKLDEMIFSLFDTPNEILNTIAGMTDQALSGLNVNILGDISNIAGCLGKTIGDLQSKIDSIRDIPGNIINDLVGKVDNIIPQVNLNNLVDINLLNNLNVGSILNGANSEINNKLNEVKNFMGDKIGDIRNITDSLIEGSKLDISSNINGLIQEFPDVSFIEFKKDFEKVNNKIKGNLNNLKEEVSRSYNEVNFAIEKGRKTLDKVKISF